ncbi:TetR/AcrR family transcriptional regulator [Maritimibacter sp. UBA3975]|uniref:TetR/AcrR family transcriptional regulator n=1 Tax=Maritimibacter sp. UBA3975 TaxID=1946833 RepID=UPI000C09414C|nr:TetR/AcrR family transcriptional regulator [Maritimibacter sp. UBA3975]MAM63385.1 TetR family transcriptional regulator [Maritimibacter sp.]|tara:strand:+ start:95266 stop:95916 length:651 start_codon:yes stop_codon:yes gene_type:complete
MKDEQLRRTWKQDAEGVKHDILMVAMAEFAEHGLAGARIDEIAEKTKTSKRMIYYYFGDKDGLYLAALEAAYTRVRAGEEDIDIEGLGPRDAMGAVIRFTFEHHRAHPELIRMVMNENVNHAAYLKKSEFLRDLNLRTLKRVERILARGQDDGVFRKDVDALMLHWQIQAQSFYNVSNRPSFSTKFGEELFSDEGQNVMRETIVDSVLTYLTCKAG